MLQKKIQTAGEIKVELEREGDYPKLFKDPMQSQEAC